jgi:ketosteroid isomerase-like protein
MNKSSWRLTPLVVLLVSGLLGCAMVVAAPDPQGVALEAAVQRWVTAVNTQDVNALATTMTEDVELLDIATTETGREGAIRALREAARRGKLVAAIREVSIAGDLAWRVVSLTQVEKSGVVHARGHAVELWKRVNGAWMLHRLMAPGVINPAVTLTRPSPTDPVLDKPRD